MPEHVVTKYSNLGQLLWNVLRDSEGLEILCSADHEDTIEQGFEVLIDEILNAMGEGDIEPWTKEDRIEYQKELLRSEILRAQHRLNEIENGSND